MLPTKISLHELRSSQFSSWYPTFRNLSKHQSEEQECQDPRQYTHNNVTIKSVVIKDLPTGFLEYLKSDGVKLPAGAEQVSSFLPDDTDDQDYWSSDDENEQAKVKDIDKNEDNDSSNSEEQEEKEIEYHFPTLNQQIEKGINSLGGQVIPKLNWSAPKDVTWLNASTMKCSTVGDIYLMIKSSDFCMHDLIHALDDVEYMGENSNTNACVSNENIGEVSIEDSQKEKATIEYELILRKWSNLHPSMEFRCFVNNHQLVAISQRNHSQVYPHLKREYMTIRSHIIDLFEDVIGHNYAKRTIPNYTFDVYVDKDSRVWLIDFNIWSVRTDSLLFTWEELVKLSPKESKELPSQAELDVISVENVKPEMRVVQTENEVHYDPLASYRGPVDAVELASEDGTSQSFQEFMKMCERPSDRTEEDDE